MLRWICVLWLSLAAANQGNASEMHWQSLVSSDDLAATPAGLAQQHHDLMQFFVQQSLHGDGKKAFNTVSKRVKLKIHWRTQRGYNHYEDAFLRSADFTRRLDFKGMPLSIMLIAYLESQWQAKLGHPNGDYGYWQMVPEVLKEIQALDYVHEKVRNTPINELRESSFLSTKAAQVHLRRYYFYFAKVAQHRETDAWLFSFIAFNWGAGNVKRMQAEMKAQGLATDFSSFYHYLYQQQQQSDDLSLRAALEYIPSLWAIAQLLKS